MKLWIWLALPALLFSQSGQSELPAKVVEGDLVDAITGAPIAGARVVLGGDQARDNLIVSSDASGHFRTAPSKPSNRIVGGATYHLLLIGRPGYINRGAEVSVTDAANGVSRRIAMMPQSVISGTVTDEDGFPVQDASVEAMHYRMVDGERKLDSMVLSSATGRAAGWSNDLGQYRIADLPAGRYYLRVTLNGPIRAWDPRYVGQYCGGTLQLPEKDPVEVKAGEQRGQVECRIRKYEGVTVTGHLTIPPDLPSTVHPIILLSPDSGGNSITGIFDVRSGMFFFRHIPADSYKLRLQPNRPSKPGDPMVEESLQVGNSDISGLNLAAHPIEAIELRGNVVFEGGLTPRPVNFSFSSRNGQRVEVQAAAEGSFFAKNLQPGDYEILGPALFSPNPNARMGDLAVPIGVVRSVKLGSDELASRRFTVGFTKLEPLQLIMSPAVSVTAKIIEASGRPAQAAYVSLVPDHPGSPVNSLSDENGSANITGVPPGTYHVYILPDHAGGGELQDPDWLKAHESDFPALRVVAGMHPSIRLTLRR